MDFILKAAMLFFHPEKLMEVFLVFFRIEIIFGLVDADGSFLDWWKLSLADILLLSAELRTSNLLY